ncbi:sensor histidine kinase [Proteiniphilum sp. UBA5310]|uniref:sensor histidine kinase n=1 Tax=Proteiniphilum sp. UBA5310 TaxID=1947275 RepID=UPI00257A82AD|nr:HAMP domain-containing sensor histidine kinase [Proteiniphilum sp. UBA5310]
MFHIQFRQPLIYLFVTLAIAGALLSLLLSDRLVNELANEERRKMEIWALATESMASNDEVDMSLVLTILESNNTIPVILYDKGTGRLIPRNIKLPEEDMEVFLQNKTEEFGRRHNPIVLDEMNQLLYYDDSHTLKQLQIYPYVELLVIALFIGLAFFALNRTQRAEQNKVWAGLSKETAHQLGTPVSSLMGWVEYLRMKGVDSCLLSEIDKDITRLQVIAERFSKIGSTPDLTNADLREVITGSLSYLEKRVSGEVIFRTLLPEQPVITLLNESLFGWVIENMAKNGVDAMQGKGTMMFAITEKGNRVILDVSDTGRGIHKSKFKTIFTPGYTTKERGWGLGLSLVKRIVEVSHGGKIFVKRSELGKGTTFRIELSKNLKT